ncbi:MAG: hypothetical protein LC799_06440, partial [Actinobacteria bacterium]|nr:hypothetical protein [Actinomycetota bacterium]
QYLLRSLSHHLAGSPMLDEGRWHGHRTFLVDGSSVSMPDTPELQQQFGQPGAQAPGCGFPVMHLLALFHAGTGFLLDVVGAPLRTHDMSRVGHVHPDLTEDDILSSSVLSSLGGSMQINHRSVHRRRLHHGSPEGFRPDG